MRCNGMQCNGMRCNGSCDVMVCVVVVCVVSSYNPLKCICCPNTSASMQSLEKAMVKLLLWRTILNLAEPNNYYWITGLLVYRKGLK